MSHRRTTISERIKEEYEKAQASIYSQSSFKDWINVTISTNIILCAICAVLYAFVHIPGIITLISLGLALSAFFILVTIHEVLHGLFASHYGYKYEFGTNVIFTIPKINRPFTSIYIEVSHLDNDKWKSDRVMIALAPHFIMLPLGLVFIFLGWYWQIFFFSILGMITIGGHLIALYIDVKAT